MEKGSADKEAADSGAERQTGGQDREEKNDQVEEQGEKQCVYPGEAHEAFALEKKQDKPEMVDVDAVTIFVDLIEQREIGHIFPVQKVVDKRVAGDDDRDAQQRGDENDGLREYAAEHGRNDLDEYGDDSQHEDSPPPFDFA